MGIKQQLDLLFVVEGEVHEALQVLRTAQQKLEKATGSAMALAQTFDTSLARLTMAGELAQDVTTVREMRERISHRIESSASAIREALRS